MKLIIELENGTHIGAVDVAILPVAVGDDYLVIDRDGARVSYTAVAIHMGVALDVAHACDVAVLVLRRKARTSKPVT